MLMNYLIYALHNAAASNDVEMIRLLILNMVTLNQKNSNGWTALHLAVKNQNTEIVKMLINANADVQVQICTDLNYIGLTPLQLAAGIGNMEIFTTLYKLTEQSNWTKSFLLDIATKCNQLRVAVFLLRQGAPFMNQPNKRWNLLHTAAKEGFLNLCALFINRGHGIPINSQSEKGFTALHLACDKGHLALVEYFLRNEADVNAETTVQFTPLHLAAQFNHLEIAELLVKEGANVNAVSNYNFTPLHLACKGGFEKMVSFLLGEGADTTALTRFGCTPADFGCAMLVDSKKRKLNKLAKIED